MKKLKLAALLALPVALGLYLNSMMSWRPRTLVQFRAPVLSVAWSPDGKQLASAGGDGNVSVWDVGSMRITRRMRAWPGSASGVAFSPDGEHIAASFTNPKNDDWGQVRLWSRRSGALEQTWPDDEPREYGMTSVAFSRDGETLAASHFANASLWNVRTGESKGSLDTGAEGRIHALALSPDARTVVGLGYAESLFWWDTRKADQEGYAYEKKFDGCFSAAFSPDSKTLAVSTVVGRIDFYDVHSQKQHGKPAELESEADALAFSPDGDTLAGGLSDGRIILWDVSSRKRGRCLRGHTKAITSLAFAPDGNTLASSGDDGTVRLWRVR